MEPLDIGPGKQWRGQLLTMKITLGAVALVLIGLAIPDSPDRAVMLITGLVFAALALGIPMLMARKEPHALLTAEGIDGPNLPEAVAWRDIRGAEARVVPARGRRPEARYVALDVPDADAYVARASLGRRVALKANAVYSLPPLTLQVGSLSKSPEEIPALVRERAAYAGPAA